MTSSKGLMILNGTEFIPVDNTSDIGSTVKTGGLLSYQDKLIVVSRDKGLFVYDGSVCGSMQQRLMTFVVGTSFLCCFERLLVGIRECSEWNLFAEFEDR